MYMRPLGMNRGSVVELDSWVASHSRAANGMRRDWVARDFDIQEVIARGTRLASYINLSNLRFLSRFPLFRTDVLA